MIFFLNFDYSNHFTFEKCAQFLSALLIIFVGLTLTMTFYCEKCLPIPIKYIDTYVVSCATSTKKFLNCI